jgi:uncharacterized protein
MLTTIIILSLVAFSAGFVDAIAGGGGLIQLPAALVFLPQFPVTVVIGTLKIPSICGTSVAAVQYSRIVKLRIPLMITMGFLALIAAFSGSFLLSVVSNAFMKPVLLVVLSAVAIYTWTHKELGQKNIKSVSNKRLWAYAIPVSVVIGFYDGFIGPGAGSFFVIAFISLLGFDFLKANAHSKWLNMATNLGSIIFFSKSGVIIWSIAIPMAICNALGGWFGARLTILRGNKFVRIVFLCVVSLTILRFAYDIFK